MLKSLALFSILLSVSAANAQSSSPADPQATIPSQPAAPIVRSYQNGNTAHFSPRYREDQMRPETTDSQPVLGVWLRSEANSSLSTVSATPQRAEFRLDRGRLNVSVHHPADHAEILVDLPGGLTSLLKDGLYTFNADTNTVRVLHGEAAAWPGAIIANANIKPIKIKEDHQLGLVAPTEGKAGELKPVESYPYEIAADLLPSGNARDYSDGYYAKDYPAYVGFPYYAAGWSYPLGYGFYPGYYSYGYGYPVIGFGVGYGGGLRGAYGGFRGTGFRR